MAPAPGRFKIVEGPSELEWAVAVIMPCPRATHPNPHPAHFMVLLRADARTRHGVPVNITGIDHQSYEGFQFRGVVAIGAAEACTDYGLTTPETVKGYYSTKRRKGFIEIWRPGRKEKFFVQGDTVCEVNPDGSYTNAVTGEPVSKDVE